MAYDPTGSVLQDLYNQDNTWSPWLALVAVEIVKQVRAAGIPLIVTSGMRSPEEQQALYDQGRTTTLNSKHLVGQAFDVDVAGYNRDDVPVGFWWVLGPWVELNWGLRWGGRWTGFWDPGHFEIAGGAAVNASTVFGRPAPS